MHDEFYEHMRQERDRYRTMYEALQQRVASGVAMQPTIKETK